jgi:hypothetical protein
VAVDFSDLDDAVGMACLESVLVVPRSNPNRLLDGTGGSGREQVAVLVESEELLEEES